MPPYSGSTGTCRGRGSNAREPGDFVRRTPRRFGEASTFHFCPFCPFGRVSITETLITQFPAEPINYQPRRPRVLRTPLWHGNFRSARRFTRPIFILLSSPVCTNQPPLFVVVDKLYKPVSNIRGASARSVKIRSFFFSLLFFLFISFFLPSRLSRWMFSTRGTSWILSMGGRFGIKNEEREEGKTKKTLPKKAEKSSAQTRKRGARRKKGRKVRTPCITVSF